MRRTTAGIIIALLLGIPLALLAADAQQPTGVRRIGYLGSNPPSAVPHLFDAFRQGLGELGYVEGQNISFEWRFAEGRLERFPDLAAELVRLRVDVIVAVTTPAALAARNATKTIPIVTVGVTDPVESGLVASFGRPGGNITGLALVAGPEIVGKHLELLKEAIPKVSRVAVLWNPTHPAHPLLLRETEGPARSLRVQLQRVGARAPDEFRDAFAAMARERAGAFIVLADPMFFGQRTGLADLARRARLPAMYPLREHVEAGGLMSYGADVADHFRRAATFVDKILKGAKPAELPVERPTKFELVINRASRES